MMRSAGVLAVAVAVAALIVCCSADPHQVRFHKTRALESLGGGNLVREVREIRHFANMPYLIPRRNDFGRSGLDSSLKKRNLGYTTPASNTYGPNYLDIDIPVYNFGHVSWT